MAAYGGCRAKVHMRSLLRSNARWTTAKQTEDKREHRQTFTDAHCDFFCMTGGTYRMLLRRGQRADGVFEVGGWKRGKVDEVRVCVCMKPGFGWGDCSTAAALEGKIQQYGKITVLFEVAVVQPLCIIWLIKDDEPGVKIPRSALINTGFLIYFALEVYCLFKDILTYTTLLCFHLNEKISHFWRGQHEMKDLYTNYWLNSVITRDMKSHSTLLGAVITTGLKPECD